MRFEFLHSHAWQVSLGRFGVLLASALLVGFAVGLPLEAALVALLAYCAWSFYSLYRIQHWLSSRRRSPPPEDWGVWSDVSAFVYRKLRTERSRKRRLVALLQEHDPVPWDIYIYRPQRGPLAPRLRLVFDALAAALAQA